MIQWVLDIATVLGLAVIGTMFFFILVGIAAWVDRHRHPEGFPRSRR